MKDELWQGSFWTTSDHSVIVEVETTVDTFDFDVLVVRIHALVCSFAVMFLPQSASTFTSLSTTIFTVDPPPVRCHIKESPRDVFLVLRLGSVFELLLGLLVLFALRCSGVARFWGQALGVTAASLVNVVLRVKKSIARLKIRPLK